MAYHKGKGSVATCGAVFLIALLTFSRLALVHGATPEWVIVAHTSLTVEHAAFWVAESQGFFEKNGINAKVVFLSGGRLAEQALLSGSVAFVETGITGVILSVAGGGDAVMIAGLVNTMPYHIVGVGKLKSVKDLAGKRIGVNSIGGGTHAVLLLALRHFGMDERKDRITILQTGPPTSRVAALEAGATDATVMQPGFTPKLQERGIVLIADLAKERIPFQHSGIVTTRKFLARNPVISENVLRAVTEAVAYIVNPPNKKKVMQVLGRKLKIASEAELEPHYQLLAELYSHSLYPDAQGIENVLEIMQQFNPKAANVKIEDLVDTSILRKRR